MSEEISRAASFQLFLKEWMQFVCQLKFHFESPETDNLTSKTLQDDITFIQAAWIVPAVK